MTGSELANEIIRRRGGTKFGVTGSYNGGNPTNDWGQCTAVPHDIEIVLFGKVLTYGHAYQMFNNAPAGEYHKLAGNVEILPGDAVFQAQDRVLGTDWPGHTFMATQRSLPGQPIVGYSQNYPTGYPPHIRTFPRNGLIGVARAKVLQSGSMEPTVPFSYADYLNGWATDGLFGRFLDRRANAPEMTLFKTLDMGTRIARLKAHPERPARIHEIFLDLQGRYATAEEQKAWYDWELGLMRQHIRTLPESRAYAASKGAPVDQSAVIKAARNGAFDEIVTIANSKKQ